MTDKPPTAEESLYWLDFDAQERMELPCLQLAKEIVQLVDRYWCSHVQQGMCKRCQKDRVRDVEWKLRTAEQAAREQGEEDGYGQGLRRAASWIEEHKEYIGEQLASAIHALAEKEE